jgi:uncharacterized membrane protein
MRSGSVSLFAQVSLDTLGGINHFWHHAFYLRMMPDHYAHPSALVMASGVAEILGEPRFSFRGHDVLPHSE